MGDTSRDCPSWGGNQISKEGPRGGAKVLAKNGVF